MKRIAHQPQHQLQHGSHRPAARANAIASRLGTAGDSTRRDRFRARYFLKMLDEGKEIPTTIPEYPVQTWCFGEDLAMVFLGGEVVVDYSIRHERHVRQRATVDQCLQQ